METKLDTTISKRFQLTNLAEKRAPHRRVELKVTPISDWPDGDWYTPCEPDRGDFTDGLILELARNYNSFLCSLIRNSMTICGRTDRRIRAALDVVLNGVTPLKLKELVEQQVRALTHKWISEHDLFAPLGPLMRFIQAPPCQYRLRKDLTMEFSPYGEIAFWRGCSRDRDLLAAIAINASIDSAGALEQYVGAAGRFREALDNNPSCENILLSVDDSAALGQRIRDDGLVTQHWNAMPLLAQRTTRERFYTGFFQSTLGLAC
jgi:hypothetical protein